MARMSDSEQQLIRATCGEADSQEEDRLSTAAPSICEEVTTRWADIVELENDLASPCKAKSRWADLLDDDFSADLTAKAPAKARWADLAESSDEEEIGQKMPVAMKELSTAAGADSWTTISRKSTAPVRSGNTSRAWTGQHKLQGTAKEPQGTGKGYGKGGKGGKSGKGAGKAEAANKGAGKAYGKAAGKGAKCQCQFTIGIEEESNFRVCRRLLGPSGQNMKDVAEKTGAKLRLRGRGSKFLEGPEKKESKDPLMLCLSAPSPAAYQEAKSMVSDLLESIYADYREFHKNESSVEVALDIHEGPRPGSF